MSVLFRRAVAALATAVLTLGGLVAIGAPAAAASMVTIVPTTSAGDLADPLLAAYGSGSAATVTVPRGQTRSHTFEGFDVSSIPANATITRVQLIVRGEQLDPGFSDAFTVAADAFSSAGVTGTNSGVQWGTGWLELYRYPQVTTVAQLETMGLNVRLSLPANAAAEDVDLRVSRVSAVVSFTTPPLSVDAIPNQTVAEGSTGTVSVRASATGNPVVLTATGQPAWADFTDHGDGTGEFTLAPGYTDASVSTVTVTASSGTETASQTFTLTATDTDRPPVIDGPSLVTMRVGEVREFAWTVVDPDGPVSINTYTYTMRHVESRARWVDGAWRVTYAPGAGHVGSHTALIDAYPSTHPITVVVEPADTPPAIDAIDGATVAEGAPFDLPIVATDVDGDAITLSATGLPGWATFTDNSDGTGRIHGTPGYDDAGVSEVTVTATAYGAPVTETFSLTVTNTDRAPTLDAITDVTVAEGAPGSIALSAQDPDGDAISFSAIGLPAWATLADNGDGTGSIHGTPGFDDAGVSLVTVMATANGWPVTTTFALTVTHTDRAPTLDAITDVTLPEGSSRSIPLSAQDLDGDSVALSATGLPAWATLTDNGDGTGAIALAPGFDDAGSATVTVTATANGLSTERTFALTAVHVNRAPAWTAIADLSIAVGDTLDVPVSAVDVDGDVLTLAPGTLPSWVTWTDNFDGTGVLSLAPTAAADLGELRVTVNASDGVLIVPLAFTVTSYDPDGPAISVPEDFTLEAVEAGGAPVDFAVSAEDFADGGVPVLCDVPQGDVLPLGTTTVTCEARDGDDNVTRASFRVTVSDTTAPVLSTAAGAALADLAIDATSADGATVEFDVLASDLVSGASAAQCSPASGSLFPVGTTTVTCTAEDGAGNTASTSFSVVVDYEAPVATPEPSVEASPVASTTPDPTPTPTDVSAERLSGTGASLAVPAGAALALMLAGVMLLAVRRRA